MYLTEDFFKCQKTTGASLMQEEGTDNMDDLDWQLCHLAQQGNAEAYTQLRQRHRERVRTELRKRCHALGQTDLEDLDQQVWIAVWAALPRYQGRSAFSTWLVGLTKNVLYTWLRHKRSTELTLLRFQELSAVENCGVEESDPLNHLSAVESISYLSESELQVIELRYFQQCADREIAARLHMPLGTVKGRIRGGLLHLRESFKSGASESSRLP